MAWSSSYVAHGGIPAARALRYTDSNGIEYDVDAIKVPVSSLTSTESAWGHATPPANVRMLH